ncbi:hypothetical protein CVV38_00910 [Candidatus Peregrinibacteria bacterium HGW-Peregrinibacteria-1]|jgi:hypothetical protein|nr:MAG: hypothetical protein CVV38_00910 [Candidatus Peregrinibacteria bacterium HGW-Peregrinibacteria-1]
MFRKKFLYVFVMLSVVMNLVPLDFANADWNETVLIENIAGAAYNQNLQVDNSGNAFAIWKDNNKVYSNRYTNGAWVSSTPEKISEDIYGTANNPKIAINNSGEAIAVWGQNGAIYANTYTNGEWSLTTTKISEDAYGSTSLPQIAMDSSGNAVAMWLQSDAIQTVYTNTYTNGEWSLTTTKISDDIDGSSYTPVLDMDDSGNAVAMWTQSNDTKKIYIRNYSTSTQWDDAHLLATLPLLTSTEIDASLDGSGNAMAVWNDDTFAVYASKFTNGGSWGGAEEISNGGFVGSNPFAKVDMASGNAFVVWRNSADGKLYASKYDGSSWVNKKEIIGGSTASSSQQQIVMNSAGNAMVVWSQSLSFANADIYTNIYDSGSWSETHTAMTGDNNYSLQPDIGVDSLGNFIILWSSAADDRSGASIYSNSYINNDTPTISSLTATPVNDGTGEISIASTVNDGDMNDLSISYYYEVGACGTYSAQQTASSTETITITSVDSATYGLANIVISGNQATAVTTASGDNTVVVTWDVLSDIPSPTGSYCVHAFVNDGITDSTTATVQITPITDWKGAALVGTNDTGATDRPQIAFDSEGNATAVWALFDTRFSIYANRYSAATNTWGTAEVIEDNDTAGYDNNPQIAVDGDGNAIAVWEQFDGTSTNVFSNTYSALTGTWGTAELLESSLGTAYGPQIAVDGDGNGIAIWLQYSGGRSDIYSARYTASTETWGAPELVETSDVGSAINPKIEFDSSNNGIAVWQQNNGVIDVIWANKYDASTGWGTAEVISATNIGNAASAEIDIDSNGNAIAVWHQNNNTEFDAVSSIYANRYVSSTGAWGTATAIESGSGSASTPAISIDNSGNAMVVWTQHDGVAFSAHANKYTALSDSWGAEEVIESYDGGTSNFVQVDYNGVNYVAVWQQAVGPNYSIWANTYDGSSWGDAEILEDFAGSAERAQLASYNSGSSIAIWSQISPSWVGTIYSNTYAPLTIPTNVTATTNGQSSIILEWDANGNHQGTKYAIYSVTTEQVLATTTNTNYIVTGLAAGSSHSFKVRAVQNGNSDIYVESTATTPVTTTALSKTVTVKLKAGEGETAFQFTGSTTTHTARVDEINVDEPENPKAVLTIQSNPVTVTLGAGESQNIDTSGNGTNDTTVTVNSIDTDSSSVNFTLTAIAQTSSNGGGSGFLSLFQPQSSSTSESDQTDIKTIFSDTAGHWGEQYIQTLLEKGIVQGYQDGNFQPDAPVTRAELLKMVMEAYDIDQTTVDTASFSDVSLETWYGPYIETAKTLDFISGYSDGTFKPNNAVNRAEALAMILNSSGLDLLHNETATFTDTQSSDWYAAFISYAVENNIIQGYQNGNFGPSDNLTRAQAAKIIVLMMELR